MWVDGVLRADHIQALVREHRQRVKVDEIVPPEPRGRSTTTTTIESAVEPGRTSKRLFVELEGTRWRMPGTHIYAELERYYAGAGARGHPKR